METNYYRILGLPPIATTSEIRLRYKALAKQYHPDVQGDTKMMSQINRAYAVLCDPLQRYDYNRTLEKAAEAERQPIRRTTPTDRNRAQTVRPRPDYVSMASQKINYSPFSSIRFVVLASVAVVLIAAVGLTWLLNSKLTLNSTGVAAAAASSQSPYSSSNQSSGLPIAVSGSNTNGSSQSLQAPVQQSTSQSATAACQTEETQVALASIQLQQEIRQTERQLSSLSRESDNQNSYSQPNATYGQSYYSQQYQALEQQLALYQSQLSSEQTSLNDC